MFNSVPYPPKDYILKDVPKIQRSSAQFTPDFEPRVTQTTFGAYCYPIEYGEGEAPKTIEVKALNPYIMDKWAKEAKAFWVDKPGKDDFFLHDMYKKYSVKMGAYNPDYMHKEKVFNRSYKYELVCLQDKNLQKLTDKCESEQQKWEMEFSRAEQKEFKEKHPPMKVIECKAEPPFWWKQQQQGNVGTVEKRGGANKRRDNVEETEQQRKTQSYSSVRWSEEPCLTAVVVDDPCRRKYDMQLVGQPFRTEACNFYYDNYPPPDIKFRPKKFI